MRTIPMKASRGRPWLEARRFRGWLAMWLQDRRRARQTTVAFSPTSVPGLKLWVRVESLSGLTEGAAVATWADESGHGRDLVQAVAASRPTYRTSVDGVPAVQFDGANDVLASASAVLNTNQHTLFLVARPVGTTSCDAVGSGGVGNGDLLVMLPFDGRVRGHSWRSGNPNTLDSSFYLLANTAALFEQEVTATQLNLRVNGVSVGVLNMSGTAAGTSKPIVLGSRSAGWWYAGYVRALLVYEGNPSAAEQAAIRDYLLTTYQVPVPYPAPASVPAPTDLDATYLWDVTTPGHADVECYWAFAHGGLSVGTFEVWAQIDLAPFVLVGTVSSASPSFYWPEAVSAEATVALMVRYVNGATVGPFSETFYLYVSI